MWRRRPGDRRLRPVRRWRVGMRRSATPVAMSCSEPARATPARAVVRRAGAPRLEGAAQAYVLRSHPSVGSRAPASCSGESRQGSCGCSRRALQPSSTSWSGTGRARSALAFRDNLTRPWRHCFAGWSTARSCTPSRSLRRRELAEVSVVIPVLDDPTRLDRLLGALVTGPPFEWSRRRSSTWIAVEDHRG